MPNLHEPDFDEPREHPGFVARRARIGRQAGAQRLGLSLWDLPPGQGAYPYHFHLAAEELVIVLEGHPSLRAPTGWRELEPGRCSPSPSARPAATSSSTAPRRPCASSPSAPPASPT